ncbi:MAG: hypothetical protein IPO99_10305 [Nitrospira sp.]|nr:hypothetical protein [Nitrospira sp.]
MGLSDLTVRTSMMEARFLAGSADLFQQFHARYVRKVVAHGFDTYLDQKVTERQREYQKFGETVYLLEPNVKKSKGGLRDLHLLQWIGAARFHTATIRELSDRGILPSRLSRDQGGERILLRVRSFLHTRPAWRRKFSRSMSRSGWPHIWASPTGRICSPSSNSCSNTIDTRWGCTRR